MRLKICITAVCVLAIILTIPISAFADSGLANSVKASDKKSVSFVGSYAENYIDGNVSFGGSGVW
jgi:hypothetical protein